MTDVQRPRRNVPNRQPQAVRAPVPLAVASSILAPAAMLRWANDLLVGGPFTDCRLWRRGMNDTYRLQAGARWSLVRVYRAGWRSDADIGYELDLLRWLARAGIAVAEPLTARDGQAVHHVAAPEGVRQAVHFAFAPGAVPPFDAPTAARLGAALAALHQATAGFHSAHQRVRLDLETLLWGPLRTATQALGHRPADSAWLTELATTLAQRLATVGSALAWGPLHGDVYPGNVHGAPDGALTWFDFDLCGEGWYAYDLAAFRMNVRAGRWADADVWPAFLGAYEERRALQPVERAALPFLGAVRDLWHLGHFLGTVRAGGEAWWLDEAYLDRRLHAMRAWVTSELAVS
jgi:Ser/Thr protein kinase RdoA (MazF antagonist)